MSEPQRLLDGGATDFEREMLASWHQAKPSTAVRERTLAMVGALGVASIGAGVAKVVATTAGTTAGTTTATSTATSALTKLVVLGVWLGASVAGIGYVHYEVVKAAANEERVETPTLDSLMAPPVSPSTPAPAPVPVRTPSPVPMAVPMAVPESAPIDPLPSSRANVPTSPQARPSGTGLAEQVAAIDRARTAVTDGDPARARRTIDDYQTRFPDGAFAQEAEVIRVEALLAQGDHAGASRAGARFLAAHPTSPHAARLRALLAGASP